MLMAHANLEIKFGQEPFRAIVFEQVKASKFGLLVAFVKLV
jgi:hypothetical protein